MTGDRPESSGSRQVELGCTLAAFAFILGAAALIVAGLKTYGAVDPSFGGSLLLPLGAVLACITAAVSGLYLRRLAATNRALAARLTAEETRADHLATAERRLRSELETLTAMREMTHALSTNVEFAEIAAAICQTVTGLVTAREVAIYLPSAEQEDLALQALWTNGRLEIGEEIRDLPQDNDVASAAEVGRTYTVKDGLVFKVILPLVADAELLGLMKAEVVLDGDARGNEERRAQDVLESIAKHVSLGIKTTNLHTRAVVDALTGLHTKRHFHNQALEHFEECIREKNSLSLIMIDIDHFKSVNDTHGHQTGDRILAGVARIIRDTLRTYDSAYRYGGEEMAVLLPGARVKSAETIAERLRKKIAKTTFESVDGETLGVTVSLGVSEFRSKMRSPEDLVEAADTALYRAKESGRDQTWAMLASGPRKTK